MRDIAQNMHAKLTGNDLPPVAAPQKKGNYQQTDETAEKQYLENLMIGTCRNIAQACKISGISRSRLYELLTKHQIGDATDDTENQQTG